MQQSMFSETPTAPPAAGKIQAERHFWRCPDCLYVMATDGPIARFQKWDNWRGNYFAIECKCGGICEYMGKVHRERITTTEYRTACDARCTSAPGPNCSCSCGGANHGTGAVVEVTIDHGNVPKIGPHDSRHLLVAKQFREAKDAAKGRIQWAFNLRQAKANGEWIREYSQLIQAERLIRKYKEAAGILNHGKRLKALAAVGV